MKYAPQKINEKNKFAETAQFFRQITNQQIFSRITQFEQYTYLIDFGVGVCFHCYEDKRKHGHFSTPPATHHWPWKPPDGRRENTGSASQSRTHLIVYFGAKSKTQSKSMEVNRRQRDAYIWASAKIERTYTLKGDVPNWLRINKNKIRMSL